MVSARFAVAVALLLALAGLTLGFAALMRTFDDGDTTPGRLVQTRLGQDFRGDPIAFPLHEFFVARGSDGELRALYAFPPGFYGHERGCRVVWVASELVQTAEGLAGPGLFVDPCGGARFTADGALVAGPADRGLDYFAVAPGVDGVVVDTRTLYCGAPLEPAAGAPTPTPSSSAGPAECDRVTADALPRP